MIAWWIVLVGAFLKQSTLHHARQSGRKNIAWHIFFRFLKILVSVPTEKTDVSYQ